MSTWFDSFSVGDLLESPFSVIHPLRFEQENKLRKAIGVNATSGANLHNLEWVLILLADQDLDIRHSFNPALLASQLSLQFLRQDGEITTFGICMSTCESRHVESDRGILCGNM